MEKLESVQYSAARAITGAWRRTSREKLYTELGWESLSCRRWCRRLTLFFKIINNQTPVYTKDPIPTLQQSNYSLCNRDIIGRLKARRGKFNSSFYPHCLSEWNELDSEVRLVPSSAVFKKKLLSRIRPPARSIFGIHDPTGLSYLTQIRVGLSKLKFHKFKHNFRDTVNPNVPYKRWYRGYETLFVALPLPCSATQRSSHWSFCFTSNIWLYEFRKECSTADVIVW